VASCRAVHAASKDFSPRWRRRSRHIRMPNKYRYDHSSPAGIPVSPRVGFISMILRVIFPLSEMTQSLLQSERRPVVLAIHRAPDAQGLQVPHSDKISYHFRRIQELT